MYKILNNVLEMDDYSLQRLTKTSSVIEYIWYKLWGNTVQSGTPTPSTPVEVKGVGDRTENLWNYTIEQGGWSASAGTIPTKLVPSDTNYPIRCRVPYMIPIPSRTMSLTCSNDIKINFVWIDSNGYSLGGSGWQRNGSTVTAPSNATTLTFILAKVDDTNCTPSDFQNIMLNEGSTALPYEPYGYKIPIVCDNEIKNIYLNEPLHKIGNYVDILSYSEHNVVRKIKKLVLTGEETNIFVYSGCGYIRLGNGLSDTIAPFCNKLLGTTAPNEDAPAFSIKQGPSDITPAVLVIKKDSNFTNINDFKQWLAGQYSTGTPVTIWYVLKETETEQIKAPDILADTYTSITVDTEVQPSQTDFTTKGEKVPQPSAETVRMLNSANTANQVNAINSIDMLNQSEELMTSEAEPSDNLIKETKAELEEPIEKEEPIEDKK